MLNTQLSDLIANIQADALAELLVGGFIDVMTAPQPQTCDTPIENQVVLVTMGFPDPAFAPSRSGVIISDLIPGVGVAEGEIAWFRAYRSDHKTAVFDGSAGKTKANMILPVRKIVEGLPVGARLSHTVVKSTVGI